MPVQLLRELGNILIDIHGQHEFQSLTRSAAQRELLDDYGRHEPLVGQVGIAHRVWLELLNRMLELEGKARDRDARLELLRYQVRELQALELKAGEVAELTAERARLANRGRLAEAAQTALVQLYESEDGSAHASVSRALQALRSLAAVDAKLGGDRCRWSTSAAIQIREAARELQHYLETLDIDTARQDQVEARLAAIEELARKHRVTPEEIAAARGAARKPSSRRSNAPRRTSRTLRKDQAAALESYRTLAQQLSARRATAGRALAQRHHRAHADARHGRRPLPGGDHAARVHRACRRTASTRSSSASPPIPGQPLRPLAKVASGGELSRLSLAVQVSCAARETRCMVFDEVDPASAAPWRRSWAASCARWARAQPGAVRHAPAAGGLAGPHHLRVTKLTDGRTTRTTLTALVAGRARRRAGAHAGRHRGHREGARACAARC